MIKKNVIFILVAVLLVFSTASCAKDGAETAAETTVSPATEVTVSPASEPTVSPVTEAAMAYLADKAADNNMIAQAAFVEKVVNGEDLFVLDIRQADAYTAGHVTGAYNVPWGSAIADSLDFLPDDQQVYVYCYSGQTAGQTVAALQVAGIDAKSVRYGFSLGISKVEGYEAIVDTTPVTFGASEGVKFNAEIKAAVADYFNAIGSDELAPSNIVSSAKAKEMIDGSEGDLVVLSIRQADAYAAGHIAGAVNIPWAAGMQEQFSTLPTDQKILTYCYSGQTAGQTVAILRLLGYDAVSIKSGMGTGGTNGTGWGNEGFPVVASN
jgi:rhodanese-related sulfurtransferase